MTFDATIPPPGWYYADGDPLGTQRYWDGSGWVGGPQPVGGVPGGQFGSPGAQFGNFAGWGPRFGAWIMDSLLIYVPFFGLASLAGSVGTSTDQFGQQTSNVPLSILAFIWLIGGWFVNFVFLQGATGQTVGKKIVGIRLVKENTGAPAGALLCFARGFVGALLGSFSCHVYTLLDYLWPLWDDKKQRLTDKMFSLSVVKVDQ